MTDVLADTTPTSVPQPVGVPWPTATWPTGTPSSGLAALVDRAFAEPALEQSYAVVVVQHGRLLAERYGGALPSFTHAPTPVTVDTPLLGWSMAKSVLHAALGVLVGEGRLDPDAPAHVPAWGTPGDPRAAITVRQLLQMRDGLRWNEDYVDAEVSDVIEMLFGTGQGDVAGFAADRPLAVAPGTRFNYSSGTSNVLAGVLGEIVGRGEPTRRFLVERVLAPIGMHDATVTLDDAGTFVGSSYVYATARSWARFGTLYLRGGAWDTTTVVPEHWVHEAQRPTSAHVDDELDAACGTATLYSHHWWLDDEGACWASGHEGQRVVVVPSLDAVIVRLGRTETERYPEIRTWLADVRSELASTA